MFNTFRWIFRSVVFIKHKQVKISSSKEQGFFFSDKIRQELNVHDTKQPIVNEQCAIYKFQCDLWASSYVSYTLRQMRQRVNEHTKQAFVSVV